MPLRRLTRLAGSTWRTELAELQQTIAELERILDDDGVLRGVIKDELTAVRDEFATPRRAEITFDPGEIGGRGPHRRRGPGHHLHPGRLHQDHAGLARSAPRAAAAGACRGPRSARTTSCPRSSTPRRTRSSCSSPTRAGCSGSRRGRSPQKERTARGTAVVNLLPAGTRRAGPGHHRHPGLPHGPVPVLRHQAGSGQEDRLRRVRQEPAGGLHRHQPARGRRAGQGHHHGRRRRRLHGQPQRG